MTAQAKIANVVLVRKPGKWGGYKIRLVTEGGRVRDSFEAGSLAREARYMALRLANQHGVKLSVA